MDQETSELSPHQAIEQQTRDILSKRQRRIPSIAELEAETNGNIAHHFRASIEAFVAQATAHPISNEESPALDRMFQIWTSLQISDVPPELAELKTQTEDFPAFEQHFLQGKSSSVRGNILQRIHSFMYETVNIQKTLYLPRGDTITDLGIYLTQGEWLALPREIYSHSINLVEKSVLEEVIALEQAEIKLPDLYHASGSAALAGIAQRRAILSSSTAAQYNQEIHTGEHVTSRRGSTLRQIYADHQPVWGYSLVRYFNESAVYFGFEQSDIEEQLKQQNDWHEGRLEWGSEGITIGSEVPTTNIKLVSADARYLPQLQTWAAQHAPTALIASYEAVDLLLRNQKILQSNTSSKAYDWHKIIRQPPIILP